ncbi:MAG: hypothetical protein ABFE07_04750 [Armatimonadia bacterium]
MQDLTNWRATLSDGRTVCGNDPELTASGLSPWKALQSKARAEGLTVTCLEAIHGGRLLTVDALGCRLATGLQYDERRRLGTGASVVVCYRWIVREGPERWQWYLTDGVGCWEVTTSPGEPGYEVPPPIERPDVDRKLEDQ